MINTRTRAGQERHRKLALTFCPLKRNKKTNTLDIKTTTTTHTVKTQRNLHKLLQYIFVTSHELNRPELISSHLLFFKKRLSNATVYKVYTHIDTIKCYGDKLFSRVLNTRKPTETFVSHEQEFAANYSSSTMRPSSPFSLYLLFTNKVA